MVVPKQQRSQTPIDPVEPTAKNNDVKRRPKRSRPNRYADREDKTLCKYPSKQCGNKRFVKKNGELHNLCEYHRKLANRNQRRLEMKRKLEKTKRRQGDQCASVLESDASFSITDSEEESSSSRTNNNVAAGIHLATIKPEPTYITGPGAAAVIAASSTLPMFHITESQLRQAFPQEARNVAWTLKPERTVDGAAEVEKELMAVEDLINEIWPGAFDPHGPLLSWNPIPDNANDHPYQQHHARIMTSPVEH